MVVRSWSRLCTFFSVMRDSGPDRNRFMTCSTLGHENGPDLELYLRVRQEVDTRVKIHWQETSS